MLARPALAQSPSPGSSYDVAIVGAGIAGMAAAQVLKAAGKSVVVLEAANRVGGRCISDNETFPGIAFERGAQWFHQVPQYNPLYQYARAHALSPTLDDAPRQVWNGSVNDPRATDAVERMYQAVTDALTTADERVNIGDPDVSGATAVSRAGLAGKPWLRLTEALIGPLTYGTEFARGSAFDLGNFSEGISGGDYLLRSGM